jgi:hypothetical protein
LKGQSLKEKPDLRDALIVVDRIIVSDRAVDDVDDKKIPCVRVEVWDDDEAIGL